MEAVGVKPQSTRRNSQLFPDRSSEKKRVIRQTFTVSCDSLMTGGELLWPEGALRSSRAC